MSLNGSQPNFAWCLADTWAGRLYIHFRRLLPITEFCQVQNSLCILQVLRSPIGSVTARQSSSGREPNFAALSTGRHLYSAGRPSRWALAHILVICLNAILCDNNFTIVDPVERAYDTIYWIFLRPISQTPCCKENQQLCFNGLFHTVYKGKHA